MGTDKVKKRQIVVFVAFYRLFWGATKSYRSYLKKREFVAFLSPFCRFYALFWKYLWFSASGFFLWGRNSLTFVSLRPFLWDFFHYLKFWLIIYRFKRNFIALFQYWIHFFHNKKSYKKAAKKRQKGGKKATNCRQKNRELEKGDSWRFLSWSVGAHPRSWAIFRRSCTSTGRQWADCWSVCLLLILYFNN